jgi:hypothetical protein
MDEDDRAEAVRRAETDSNAARNVFEALRDELNALLEEVRAGETRRAKRLQTVASDLARAVGRMVDQEDKLDGARHGWDRSASGAGVSEPSLDLDAARREVCRRLARLRAARQGDDLSGGA